MNVNFVVARENDNTFNSYFVPSARHYAVPCFQIGDKPDEHGNIIKKSINEKYHIMSKMLIDNKVITDDSIIVFIHEDINILDNHFVEKINMVFSEKPDVGVLGVAGVKQISKEGWWFNEENKPVGHMVEGVDGKNIADGNHVVYGTVGYIDNCACVEGCVLAVRGSLIKSGLNFDIDTYRNDRDIYAMDLCVQTLLKGYKVAVADMLVFHKSNRVRNISESWKISKALFNNKYKNLEFPIKPENILTKRDEIMEVEL